MTLEIHGIRAPGLGFREHMGKKGRVDGSSGSYSGELDRLLNESFTKLDLHNLLGIPLNLRPES